MQKFSSCVFIVNQLKKPTQSSNVIFKQKRSDLNLIALGFYLFIVVLQNNWHFRSDQKGTTLIHREREKSYSNNLPYFNNQSNQRTKNSWKIPNAKRKRVWLTFCCLLGHFHMLLCAFMSAQCERSPWRRAQKQQEQLFTLLHMWNNKNIT